MQGLLIELDKYYKNNAVRVTINGSYSLYIHGKFVVINGIVMQGDTAYNGDKGEFYLLGRQLFIVEADSDNL